MGIKVEFNPDLALREYRIKGFSRLECLPEKLEKGKNYKFLKKDLRNYWLEGEIPLLITKRNQELSRPIALIRILEATHFLHNNEPFTKGLYEVMDVFNENNPRINFESYKRI